MRRLAVRGVILHEGKLLCVKLKNYHHIAKPEYWCLPGGGLDAGEDLLAGLQREMIEETGVKPIIGELLYIQQFTVNNQEQLEFFFHITNTKDYLQVDLTKATHAEAEIDKLDFIDPKASYILPEFLTQEDLEQHIIHRAPTKLFQSLSSGA